MRRKSDTHNLNKSLTRGKYASEQTTPDPAIGAVNPDPGRVFFIMELVKYTDPEGASLEVKNGNGWVMFKIEFETESLRFLLTKSEVLELSTILKTFSE